ncbi:Adaptive-response sensory-kinase SasA [compost metagenome]
MIQLSTTERPLEQAFCGLAPYLIESLTHSLCAQFRADSTWACLRLPDEPGVILASAGKLPESFPIAPIHWGTQGAQVDAECRAEIVAIGSLRYEGATLDYLIGRAASPLSPLEWRRFESLFERWQAALDEAITEQRAQALAFQARLAQRREMQCKRLAAKLQAQAEQQQGVYHDLINDMTPAVFATEALQERLPSLEELGHLLLIERQFTRMRQRLRREIGAGSQGSETGCDSSRILRETIAIWQDAFARRELSLRIDLPAAPLPVAADEADVSTIVCNLLSNALKYTPPGGKIGISLGTAGRNACLVVRDSGSGIAPDVQAQLFEPGVRGRTDVEGSGVGLCQVAHIVRRLLGGISVESTLGQGSSFRVLLPLAPLR